jgi:hypothetical protein
VAPGEAHFSGQHAAQDGVAGEGIVQGLGEQGVEVGARPPGGEACDVQPVFQRTLELE